MLSIKNLFERIAQYIIKKSILKNEKKVMEKDWKKFEISRKSGEK